ncbi:MAG: phosphate acetyltransferase [Paludibacteraceae bacterium]|jgi:phosphate acetyltransferase|nr:phosphate acetyltransferase [Paludibacteraceae bacterium]
MDILDKLFARAKANKKRIILPESFEERTMRAADIVLRDGLAEIVLLGNKEALLAQAKEMGLENIDKAIIFDEATAPNRQDYVNLLYELRKNKGMTLEEANQKVKDPLYLAALMIKNGEADGEVAGAQNATSNVLRPALQIIKMKKGISVVSGAFLMITPTHYGDEGMLLFADCAVTPNPDAKQLAEIAIASASTAKGLAEMSPRVAMLSFSTHGSAKNESADKMIEATRLAKEMDPELTIDGELQLDAAIVPKVAAQKAPNSPLRGTANVLVFPNLDAGNIGYKLTQRMSGGVALGPILQGMAAPVNDLSRGCSVDDIVKMVVITSDQARHKA